MNGFGTGCCSLVYREHSVLDIFKIDRALLHRERKDPQEWLRADVPLSCSRVKCFTDTRSVERDPVLVSPHTVGVCRRRGEELAARTIEAPR
jgi:EAL domain-containing protein (putative c-di-GMP-specific phosphodiesterase class I)